MPSPRTEQERATYRVLKITADESRKLREDMMLFEDAFDWRLQEIERLARADAFAPTDTTRVCTR